MTEQRAPRKRGRPRGGSDSRERIIGAAVDEFGEQGYDGSTVRSIASRAGVDSALVHHSVSYTHLTLPTICSV